MTMHRTLIVATLLALLAPTLVALELPRVFSDHMVLQRDQPLPVWGRGASPGETVTVTLGDVTATATADAAGAWRTTLPAQAASAAPTGLSAATATTSVRFDDVLVGEVWLCSGQSNMDWEVKRTLDADLEQLAARRPMLRLFKVDHVSQAEPRFSSRDPWQVSDPESVAEFSSVGYQFGVMLHGALDVPVGLIHVAWGGTPAIAWTRASALDHHPLLAAAAAEWEKNLPEFPKLDAIYQQQAAAYRAQHGLAADVELAPGRFPDAPPRPRFAPNSPHRPGNLAAGILGPVAPYAARGVIWYQGESDAGWEPARYDERLTVLFQDWRNWWENPQLAVGIVQLASFMPAKSEPSDDPWPQLRESQRRFAAADPHAGLIAAIDAGEANDIHPRDKITIGRRLARWALADIYQKISLSGGPDPVAATADASGLVTIAFRNTGIGLWALGGPPLGGFTMAGADGVFHPAEARISQDRQTVALSSAAVAVPERVRYGWQNNPHDANLVNEERLPAAAFELPVTRP